MALVGQISWGSLFSDVGRMSIVKIAVLLMLPDSVLETGVANRGEFRKP